MDVDEFRTLTNDLERCIRFALRFDLDWHPDDARMHAEELAHLVAYRFTHDSK